MDTTIEGMMQSSSIKEIAAALAKFIAQVKQPAKNAKNPHFGNRYADLNAVIETASQPLADNGLSFMQTTRFSEGTLVLRTVVMHTSGEWVAGEYPVLPVKPDPQGYGSAMTYARRYSLSAALGLAADDDDDGNAGSGKPATASSSSSVKPPAVKTSAPAVKPAPPAKPVVAVAKPTPTASALAGDDLEDLDAAQAAATAADGNPSDFVVTIGKNNGKKLAEVSRKAIEWYANELSPTNDDGLKLQAAAKAFLALQPA
jgi:hypothetical protein